MGRETLALGFALLCSLGIMTWIVWSERPVEVPAVDQAPPNAQPPTAQGAPPAVSVDPDRVAELEADAEADPLDVTPRTALGDLYFAAHDFESSVPWYEASLALQPDDLDASTNLGVAYFYAGRPERAIEQFETSLALSPDHPQTLLNLGIVLAFGLNDVDGATTAWERVLEVAPDGREARAAREALGRVEEMVGGAGVDAP